MAISLYDASVRCYLQTLDAVGGLLDKGLAHCRERGIDPETIVEAAIIADMRPFRFQITSTVHHSIDAIEALRTGRFYPPTDKTPYDYAGLRTLVRGAADALRAMTPEAIDARAGAEVVFELPAFTRLFTAEAFVLSYSLPNFHFHATTAYDILRARGVPLGKRDYTGVLRLKE